MQDVLLDRIALFGKHHPRGYPLLARIHNALGGNTRKIKGRNHFDCQRVLYRHLRIDIEGSNNRIVIAPHTDMRNMRIYIRGNGNMLSIGSECVFNGGSFHISGNGGSISVGDNTTIQEASITVTEGASISIGQDCGIAYDVDIRCGDSHTILDVTTGERINNTADISIGNHVWIATHVQVLKGVTVGDDSVLGIRSVVINSIPSNVIAFGIPARVVRKNVTWSRKIITGNPSVTGSEKGINLKHDE